MEELRAVVESAVKKAIEPIEKKIRKNICLLISNQTKKSIIIRLNYAKIIN